MRKLLASLALALSLTACANINDKNNTNKDRPKLEAVKDNKEDKGSKDVQSNGETVGDYKKHQEVIYEYFDTVTTFLAYSKSDEEFKHLSKILKDELERYHKLYNSYDNFDGVNNFRTINENAGIKPVKVDKEVIDLIKYSKEMYELTEGKIDIAMGSLLGLWHEYRQMSINNPQKAAIPEESDLIEAGKHKDIDAIKIDETNLTVYIDDKDVQIDIGAIGKGYATKKIAEKLKAEGLSHGILSVGGDDVIIGDNPAKSNGNYNIAIQNPNLEDQDNKYISIIALKDTSVVTSGDYQRYFLVDGKRYHHIIDPDTLYPSTKWTSVTVSMDDIALADTLSTYLFIVDHKKGEQVAKKYDAKVLWVDRNGNEYKTDDYEAIEKPIK